MEKRVSLKGVKMYKELMLEIERMTKLIENRKLTLGEEMWIQHIWAKTKQLNDHWEEKDYYKE